MAFMKQYQHLLNQEGRDDRQLKRQDKPSYESGRDNFSNCRGKCKRNTAPGFFQSICNFLTGKGAGSGNLENGSTFSEKVHRRPSGMAGDS